MELLALGIILIVGIGIGVTIGIFVGVERMRKAVEEQSVGNLRIDRSDPYEPPMAFMEMERGISIETIAHKNFVMLKVIDESYISCD